MSDEEPPEWDQTLAQGLVGRKVIVGLTYEETTSTHQEQIVGLVELVDRDNGIAIRITGERHNNELFWLPPDLRQFQTKASAREYRFRSTGEVVIDPDYALSWTVTPPRTSH